jgi:hypothetical protein
MSGPRDGSIFQEYLTEKFLKIIVSALYEANVVSSSVAEPHHFSTAPAPRKIFDAAPAAPAQAPTLQYTKATF